MFYSLSDLPLLSLIKEGNFGTALQKIVAFLNAEARKVNAEEREVFLI